jgi:hypothetical protein
VASKQQTRQIAIIAITEAKIPKKVIEIDA